MLLPGHPLSVTSNILKNEILNYEKSIVPLNQWVFVIIASNFFSENMLETYQLLMLGVLIYFGFKWLQNWVQVFIILFSVERIFFTAFNLLITIALGLTYNLRLI